MRYISEILKIIRGAIGSLGRHKIAVHTHPTQEGAEDEGGKKGKKSTSISETSIPEKSPEKSRAAGRRAIDFLLEEVPIETNDKRRRAKRRPRRGRSV